MDAIILIFAGTTEGREMAEFLNRHHICSHVCVATEYGESLLPKGDYITVHAKRLDEQEIICYMQENHISMVIDATHPYAVVASENISKACEACGIEYIRLLRKSERKQKENQQKEIWVNSTKEAVEYLKHTHGNVLVTTGSKELFAYTELPDYQQRLYARVLSTPSVVAYCAGLGLQGKHLICMQGPFSEELNYAMLKQVNASYLVTKESGKAGGFAEKLKAAERAEAAILIIGRQREEVGYSEDEVKAYLYKKLTLLSDRTIHLIGIGMGSRNGMTIEALEACKKADLIVGAKRMTDSFNDFRKPVYQAYEADEIKNYLNIHPEYENIAIVLSGDTGFYSGAKKLIKAFSQDAFCADEKIEVISGISSVVYLCSKLKTSWDDVTLMSLHGREANILNAVKKNKKVFALIGKKNGVNQLCAQLLQSGCSSFILHVGENLSYENEKITTGNPAVLYEKEYETLSVVLIENPNAVSDVVTYGMEEEVFIRGKVPMTKSEIRSISLSKLKLKKDSVIYDIGAGTGSVSIEMALLAEQGFVYAIEKKEEAAALIKENSLKFGTLNLEIIKGIAPDILEELPIPTHAFIGGSSGNMKQIIECIFHKNPKTRIVINAIALETISEAFHLIQAMHVEDVDIVNATIGKSKEVGTYHMMMGQNPVFILSFTGCEVEI